MMLMRGWFRERLSRFLAVVAALRAAVPVVAPEW